MLSYGEICQRVAQNVGVPPTDAYAVLPGGIIPRLVQDAYQQIWDSEQWPQLVADDFVQEVSNANSPNGESTLFTLPKTYGPILRAYNISIGQPVKLVDRSSFADLAYNVGVGNSLLQQYDALTQLPPVPVSAQPAATGALTVVTTVVDTTTIVFVRGFNANNFEVSEAITLNSTTPVSSTNSYSEIHAISKTKIPTTGLITIKDSSSNTISQLSPYDKQPMYRRYQMNGVGSVPFQLMLTCKKVFVPFQNLFDYAIIEMDMAIIKKAEALTWMQKRQPTLAQLAAAEAEKALAIIRAREINDENVVLMCPQMRG